MIKPLRDKIIVKPEPRVKSLILDTSTMAEADSIGIVIAVGDEAQDHLSVGDKVLFGTLGDTFENEYLKFEELNLDGERHLKMSWKDICAVMEEV